MTGPPAFFLPVDENRYLATELTRGPWSPEHQHAGPPTALLGRSIARAVADDPALLVARLTVDLLSPIPITTLEVRASLLRAGRQARRVEATLSAAGRLLCRATALCLRTGPVPGLPASMEPVDAIPGPDASEPIVLPWFHHATGYHTAVDGRLARGELGRGPAAAWIRARVPLVAGEAASPLERVLIAADSGNGVAVVLDPRRFTFVNADLTVTLFREPEGEWIGLDATTIPGGRGVGLTETRLLDRQGLIGRALQTLVIARRAT